MNKIAKRIRSHEGFSLTELFEQTRLVTDGGQAQYRLEIVSADMNTFVTQAIAVVDFDGDGVYNVWTVDESGAVREKISN